MKAIYLLTVVLLAGCAQAPAIYNPSFVEESKLATINQYKPEKNNYEHLAYVHEVYTTENIKVIKPIPINASHKSIQLQAGNYRFVFRCGNGVTYSFPELTATIEAGVAYTMYCEEVVKKDAFLSLDLISMLKINLVRSNEFSTESIKTIYY
ncbi:hypothetical protein QWY82_04745 [Simiduia curdlanivorans]|uniref:Lipoprotein n=1 Tax=Simiduia curdlanivorans TaxID=1492769 RepID=A0ABV8V0F6_9GAMM|nr:hypothetical protein [Simiduia curdlanivorans]MDN3638116.1 hypothetical protein [Simiduia curdlanivorans]